MGSPKAVLPEAALVWMADARDAGHTWESTVSLLKKAWEAGEPEQPNYGGGLTKYEKLQLPLGQILPVRIANTLEKAGILTVGAVLHVTPAEILALPYSADATLKTIQRAVTALGFGASEDSPETFPERKTKG